MQTTHPDPLQRLTPDQATLLVVDLQEKLLLAMDRADDCVAAALKMIRAAQILKLPVLMTEQYPAGLGHTLASVREAAPESKPIEKLLFSACTDQVTNSLADSKRRQVIVVGIESHVCVQQSVLDLLRAGYSVWLCADAVTSRRPFDREIALQRLRQAGAIITTTESAIFELLKQAGTDQFRQMLKIVK
jgi:nicotinamidase-related amidase